MAFTGAQLIVAISVEGAEQAKAALQGVGQQVQQTGEKAKEGGFSLSRMFQNALSFAAGGLIQQGLGILKDQIQGIFTESMDAAAGLAQTNQVIASTHGIAGVAAQAVLDLATKFSHLTKFSDDTVQAGENMLLTFTNIGKNVFPQATQTVLDMSQALGQDAKSSAIQLGKALNDPITGVTALQRVGVTFSQTQKDQIKNFMDTNNIAGAQGVILKELQKEFGGSAEAAGKTFGGQLAIAGQRLDDLKQTIGDKLMPILAQFLGWVEGSALPALQRFGSYLVSTFGPAFRAVGGIIQQVIGYLQGDQFAGVIADFQTLATEIGQRVAPVLARLGPILQQIGAFFQAAFSAIGPLLTGVVIPAIDNVVFFIGALLAGVRPIDPIFKGAWNVFMQIGSVLQGIGSFLASTFTPLWKQLVDVWSGQILPSLKQLWAALVPLWPVLQQIGIFVGGVLVVAFGILVGVITGVVKALAGFLGGVASIIGGIVQVVTGVVQVISGIVTFFVDLLTGHFDKLGGDLKRIWDGIVNMFVGVWNIIKGIFQAAWGAISGFVSGLVQGVIGFFTHLANSLVGHSIIPDMINAIVGFFAGLLGRVIGFVVGFVNNVISFFASLPGRAMGAIGGLIGMLAGFFGGLAGQAVSWGWNIINNLAGGIINGIWNALGGAMDAVGNFIRSHLPFSPAKRGPLRDLALAGSKIPEQIGIGMVAGLPKLQSSLNLMLTPVAGVAPMMASSGVGVGGRQDIHVHVYLDKAKMSKELLPAIAQQIRVSTGAKF
jgi:phage-related protein